MIKNDRQYKLTKAQLRTFEQATRELDTVTLPKGIDPGMMDLQKRAMESQQSELSAEIQEYEELRDGKVFAFTARSLDELPHALIKARIALGLTQKDLADRLEVKEQQVQRWEANDYSGASIGTIKQIVTALGIETRDEIFVPNPRLTGSVFLKNLSSLGITKDFIVNRLLPPSVAAVLSGKNADKAGLKELLQAAGYISRVFGTQISEILTLGSPRPSLAAASGVRFKLPARTNRTTVNAYTVYAHYLALLIESCASASHTSEVPRDWADLHRRLSKPDKPISFQEALGYLWDCGFVILPLRDSGAFHGAVWKIRNHYVIALKQKTALEARWLFDLLHELAHVALGHVTDDLAVVEELPISLDNSGPEEDQASEWAEDVIFDGESEAIEVECTRACKGDLRLLRGVIGRVSKSFNINLGALANHMAYRLASEGQDWWGNANNLQLGGTDPFEQARTELLQRIDLKLLNPIDRELVMRAITEDKL